MEHTPKGTYTSEHTKDTINNHTMHNYKLGIYKGKMQETVRVGGITPTYCCISEK